MNGISSISEGKETWEYNRASTLRFVPEDIIAWANSTSVTNRRPIISSLTGEKKQFIETAGTAICGNIQLKPMRK